MRLFHWQPKAGLLKSYSCLTELHTARIPQQNEIKNSMI